MKNSWITGSVLVVFIAVFLPDEIASLECYVCTRQEGNTEKCLSTTKTCETEENACQTELRWGSTPYWSQGAEKQYYVTKRCARKEDCEKFATRFTSYCHRIWYEDWKCAECCQGDRCNYYIIMGAGNLRISWQLLLLASTAAFIVRFFLK